MKASPHGVLQYDFYCKNKLIWDMHCLKKLCDCDRLIQ